MGMKREKLPASVTVELLKHMSEEGRFEQTLSDFPDLGLQEIRDTFAWLASQVDEELQTHAHHDRKMVDQFLKKRGVSSNTKKVLKELSPEEGASLLRNFGALD
jgi:hypothetical protein